VVTRKIDWVFGDGYAAPHPELVATMMASAASRGLVDAHFFLSAKLSPG
jgi:hypothetical protein